MKTISICMFFLTSLTCYSFSNDSTNFSREGLFDYALIKNNSFYVSLRPALIGYTNVVRKTNLKTSIIPFRHAIASSYDSTKSFNWCLKDDIVLSYHVITDYHAGRRLGLAINIVYREFETRDSVKVSQEPPQRIIENKIDVIPVFFYFQSLMRELLYQEVVEQEVDKFYAYLNFDIYFDVSDSLLNFYMRDKDVFYIWEAPLPKDRTWNTEWRLKNAYAAPHYDPNFIPRTHNRFYDSTKTHHYAITDTLFFDGHFKVLEQDGEKYIINREHAIIYHMGEAKITPIGRVLVTEDYPKIQGKALFIEDRDHNRFIFFAPVKWEETDLPKPNVYYMKEEEMREYFKYVMN